MSVGAGLGTGRVDDAGPGRLACREAARASVDKVRVRTYDRSRPAFFQGLVTAWLEG
jgi:hypothetical protein